MAITRSMTRTSNGMPDKRVSQRMINKFDLSGKEAKMYGVGSYAQVFHGTALKTPGGLMIDDLMMNKRGRIVSKAKHQAGKLHMYANPQVKKVFKAFEYGNKIEGHLSKKNRAARALSRAKAQRRSRSFGRPWTNRA